MTKSEHYLRIEEFMQKAQQETPSVLKMPDLGVRLLRAKLIMEECLETIEALGVEAEVRYVGVGAGGSVPITHQTLILREARKEPNIVEIADGCADISVVTIGTLIACGIPDVELLRMVDESNLAKFTGDAHRCPTTGKWIKPSDWKAPDIAQLLLELSEYGDAT